MVDIVLKTDKNSSQSDSIASLCTDNDKRTVLSLKINTHVTQSAATN